MASAFEFLSGFQGVTAHGQGRSLSRKGHGESSVLSVTSSDRESRRLPHRVGLPPFGMGILYCAHFGKSSTSLSVFVSSYSLSHSSVDGVLAQHAQGPGLNPQDPVNQACCNPSI